MTDYRGLREYLAGAHELVRKGFPGDGFRRATTAMEEHARSLLPSDEDGDSLYHTIEILAEREIINEALARCLHQIRIRRNELTHELRDASEKEACDAIRTVEQFCVKGPRLAWQFRSPFRIGRMGIDRPVRDALVLMREKDFSQLLVIDESQDPIRRSSVVGIVTEWSILEAWRGSSQGASALDVRDCLAREKPGFCAPHDDAESLWGKLRKTPLVCLVERDGEEDIVTGVIVRADLISVALAESEA